MKDFCIKAAMLLGSSIGCLAVVQSSADGEESAKVEIKDVSHKELRQHVTKQKGKVVAMDVWATWCVPCKEKFPKFVLLSKKYKDKVKFVSMSIDDEDAKNNAVKYLKEQKATFANFRMTDDSEEFLGSYGFDSVPMYIVWDGAGKVVLKTKEVTKVEEKLAELAGKKESE